MKMSDTPRTDAATIQVPAAEFPGSDIIFHPAVQSERAHADRLAAALGNLKALVRDVLLPIINKHPPIEMGIVESFRMSGAVGATDTALAEHAARRKGTT